MLFMVIFLLNYYFSRLFNQILNMPKRRTSAPNLKCLKVSASIYCFLNKCFRTGAQAEFFESQFPVLQINTWSLISMIKET